MKKQYKLEEAHQRKMTDENWRKYNSPTAQRNAMRLAGINPFAGDSSVAGMQVSADASSPSLMEAPDPAGGFGSAIQAGASSLFQMEQQAKLTDAEVKLKESQARNQDADTQGKENENSMFDLNKRLKELAVGNAELEKMANEIDLKYRDAKNAADLEQVRALISKTLADENVSIAQKEVLERQLSEIDAKIRNLDANTSKTNAETRTENELRPLRKEQLQKANSLTDEQIKSIGRDIGLKDTQHLDSLVDVYRKLVRSDATNFEGALANIILSWQNDSTLPFDSEGLEQRIGRALQEALDKYK